MPWSDIKNGTFIDILKKYIWKRHKKESIIGNHWVQFSTEPWIDVKVDGHNGIEALKVWNSLIKVAVSLFDWLVLMSQ